MGTVACLSLLEEPPPVAVEPQPVTSDDVTICYFMTLTLTYHRGAGVNKQRGQVLSAVTVGEARGSGILVVSIE